MANGFEYAMVQYAKSRTIARSTISHLYIIQSAKIM